MVKNHLSRLVAPRSWPMKRKGIKFIARPRSGPHKLEDSITLKMIMQNFLKQTATARETKIVLNNGKVFVDNKIVKDPNYPISLMDTISIPSLDEYYRVLIDEHKKFKLNKITKENANLKLCKIIDKTLLKKNKLQINFSDGRNKIAEDKKYKVGDTLVLTLDKNEIKNHLKLEKGASIYLIAGKHKGLIATLESIELSKDTKEDRIKLKKGSETFETLKNYAFVIDNTLL